MFGVGAFSVQFIGRLSALQHPPPPSELMIADVFGIGFTGGVWSILDCYWFLRSPCVSSIYQMYRDFVIYLYIWAFMDLMLTVGFAMGAVTQAKYLPRPLGKCQVLEQLKPHGQNGNSYLDFLGDRSSYDNGKPVSEEDICGALVARWKLEIAMVVLSGIYWLFASYCIVEYFFSPREAVISYLRYWTRASQRRRTRRHHAWHALETQKAKKPQIELANKECGQAVEDKSLRLQKYSERAVMLSSAEELDESLAGCESSDNRGDGSGDGEKADLYFGEKGAVLELWWANLNAPSLRSSLATMKFPSTSNAHPGARAAIAATFAPTDWGRGTTLAPLGGGSPHPICAPATRSSSEHLQAALTKGRMQKECGGDVGIATGSVGRCCIGRSESREALLYKGKVKVIYLCINEPIAKALEKGDEEILIILDSQTAADKLKKIAEGKPTPDGANEMYRRAWKDRVARGGLGVAVMWVKRHKGIKGNAEADKAAKVGAFLPYQPETVTERIGRHGANTRRPTRRERPEWLETQDGAGGQPGMQMGRGGGGNGGALMGQV
ncbi:hypothetical protein BDZ91DRAFT_802560 [Kalaharituber pfeilii]|nr:hypothetical protein BDZ91DRAFT_802560 [Kalaharituber pfeilii]